MLVKIDACRCILVIFLSITPLKTVSFESVGSGDRPEGLSFAGRSPVFAENGMAATAQPLATLIAIDVLKKGGSAVDAAIAANAALGVMEPVANGIGGDLFALVWDPETGKLYGLNASGRAPRGQDIESLKQKLDGSNELPLYGSLTVTVPGTVDGWFKLHGSFGRLDMKQLLSPAIEYAREGFPVSPIIAREWRLQFDDFEAHADEIEELRNIRKTYLIDGRTPDPGQIFRNPNLAATLESLAEQGRNVFYEGDIARNINDYMRRIGGPLRYEDFSNHTSEWVDPVCTDYRHHHICELPPSTQGIAVLQMLNILEGYDIASLTPGSAELLHLQIEAKRLAFEDRARYYADPEFSRIPIEDLISKEYADTRRQLINKSGAMPAVISGDPKLNQSETTYLTVADKDGMMVSLIQSNYSWMGSGLVPDGLGFSLQNRGNLFSLDAEHPNAYAPGKRPFHTIIPAFALKDGKPWLSFGVMGGAMQPQGQVQVLINLIDFEMNLQEAGDTARFRHDGSSRPHKIRAEPHAGTGEVTVESGIRNEEIKKLRRMGHNVRVDKSAYGGYQAIMYDAGNGIYIGASEMRKDGMAAGY